MLTSTQLLSPRDVAKRLALHPHTVSRGLCGQIEIDLPPAFRLGSRWRFRQDEVEKFIDKLSGKTVPVQLQKMEVEVKRKAGRPRASALVKAAGGCSMSETQLQRAAQAYLERKAGKSYPAGQHDGVGRWYPNSAECQPCCAQIRAPSRAWSRTLKLHCCSAAHVAQLFNVDELELKRAARMLVKASKVLGAA